MIAYLKVLANPRGRGLAAAHRQRARARHRRRDGGAARRTRPGQRPRPGRRRWRAAESVAELPRGAARKVAEFSAPDRSATGRSAAHRGTSRASPATCSRRSASRPPPGPSASSADAPRTARSRRWSRSSPRSSTSRSAKAPQGRTCRTYLNRALAGHPRGGGRRPAPTAGDPDDPPRGQGPRVQGGLPGGDGGRTCSPTAGCRASPRISRRSAGSATWASPAPGRS